MLNIAIIGVGNISVEHIQAYQNNPRVHLVAFCDIDKQVLVQKGEAFHVKNLFTDIDDMFKAMPEIDAVSICTWNTRHAEHAIKALEYGKHVLSEKPMAENVEDAIRMKEAADKSGKTLMIGFVRRFGRDAKVLDTFIKNDYFGEFYYAKAELLRRHGNPGGWFSDKSRSGGGPLIDLGVHVIDLVRYLMGKPKVVSVYGATFNKILQSREKLIDRPDYVSNSRTGNEPVDVEDLAVAMIRFDNGVVLNVEASFSLNIKEDRANIEMFGDKAGFTMNPEIELFTDHYGHLVNVAFDKPTALDFSGLFQAEIDHFVEVVLDGVECISPAEDGIEMMRILTAIYKSARLEKEIKLEEKI